MELSASTVAFISRRGRLTLLPLSTLTFPTSSPLPVLPKAYPRMTYPFSSIPNPAPHPFTSFPKSINLTILATPLLPPSPLPLNMSRYTSTPTSNQSSKPSPPTQRTLTISSRSFGLSPCLFPPTPSGDCRCHFPLYQHPPPPWSLCAGTLP